MFYFILVCAPHLVETTLLPHITECCWKSGTGDPAPTYTQMVLTVKRTGIVWAPMAKIKHSRGPSITLQKGCLYNIISFYAGLSKAYEKEM